MSAGEWVPELRIDEAGVTTVAQHLMRGGEIVGSIVPVGGLWQTRTGLMIENTTDETTAKRWVEALWSTP